MPRPAWTGLFLILIPLLACGHSHPGGPPGDAAVPIHADAALAECAAQAEGGECAPDSGDDAGDGDATPAETPWACGDAGVFGQDAGNGAVNWAMTFGKTGVITPGPIAIDPATGEIAVVGTSTFGSADFGAGPVTNSCPAPPVEPSTSPACLDVFVARFDACGGTKWGKMIGGEGVKAPVLVAVGPAGETVVGGQLSSGASVDFGCGSLPAPGAQPFFVAAFDNAGSCVFSKSFGSTANPERQSLTALAVDGAGNVVLAGEMATSSPIDFGGGPVSGWTFLAKLGPKGGHLWSSGLRVYGVGPAVAVDGSGDAILAATVFQEPDADRLGDAALTAHSEAALIKYDAVGNELWSKVFEDITEQAHVSESAIAVDAKGNIALLGSFSSGTIDFGMGYVTAGAAGAAFVVSLDSDGGTIWRKALQPMGTSIIPGSVAGDEAGGITITASFTSSAAGGDAGTIDFGGGSVPASSSAIAHFDSTGRYKWAYELHPPSSPNGAWATLSGVAAARTTAVVAGGLGGNCSGTSACLMSPAGVTIDLSGKTVAATSATDTFLASLSL